MVSEIGMDDPLEVRGAFAVQVRPPTVHERACAAQLAATLQVPLADATPAVHVAVATPTVGAVLSWTVTELPVAPPGYAASQVWPPCVQLIGPALQLVGPTDI